MRIHVDDHDVAFQTALVSSGGRIRAEMNRRFLVSQDPELKKSKKKLKQIESVMQYVSDWSAAITPIMMSS